MKKTCIHALILALVAVLVPVHATAQEIDEPALLKAGWEQVDEGFWERQTVQGTVQHLAYGNGKMLMVPQLRAEIDHVLASFNEDPTAKKAKAIETLSARLAELLAPQPRTSLTTKVGPCTPWMYFDYHVSAATYPPPGAIRNFLAHASAHWDGNGLPCTGYTYNRASYSLTLSAGGTVSDLDWCVDSDDFEGTCGVFVTSPTGPFSACTMEAYSYLSIFNGQYVLSESANQNTCY